MIEIQIVGRGGQGAVLASQILATVFFERGLWVQAFPSFGAERRGAPVAAFLRVADRQIRTRSAIRRPDWVIAFAPGLLASPAVRTGATAQTTLLANQRQGEGPPDGPWGRVFRVDATAIAHELGLTAGSFPLVNTAMAGAFAGASGLLAEEEIAAAVRRFVTQKAQANEAAAREAYSRVREVAR